ncbi:MAG: hypothetical protein ACOZEN_15280 [Thermodesulfobacteriota bacterium]
MARPSLAAALLAVLVLAGCQGAGKRMTLEEFNTFCNDQFAWNEDCDSGDICQSFRSALSQEHSGRAACHAACNKVDTAQWMENVMTSCAATVGNASDWCEQYCNRKYPK